MRGGYISKNSVWDIFKLFKNYSRTRGSVIKNNFTGKIVGGITNNEINYLMENMKIYILSSLSNTLYTLKTKEKEPLAIYCPWCKKNHALHECLANKTIICSIYELDHDVDTCPILPNVKMVITEKMCFIGVRWSHQFF